MFSVVYVLEAPACLSHLKNGSSEVGGVFSKINLTLFRMFFTLLGTAEFDLPPWGTFVI